MTKATALAMDAPLPWLADVWSGLQLARLSGRLAHGLLISGSAGIGKRHLGELLARSLLCHDPAANGIACGQCGDCRLLRGESHPDLMRVGPDPEAKSDEIPIAAVRALVERGALTPSRAAWKVALIDPADRLNAASANALLKTLEEPPGTAFICLITEQPGRLPATIRSRCQHVRIATPHPGKALEWLDGKIPGARAALRLQLAYGAPLRALIELDDALIRQRRERLAGFIAIAHGEQDPIAEAAIWNGIGPRRFLEWLAAWLIDLLRLAVTDDPARLDSPDHRDSLGELAGRIDPAAAHRLLQRVLRSRLLAETSANPQLLLESLSIEWRRVNAVHASRRS